MPILMMRDVGETASAAVVGDTAAGVVIIFVGDGDIFVVVVRYFGGIKLGAGGLVRAYSSAVQAAYDAMECEQVVSLRSLQLYCAFDEEQKIRYLVDRYQGLIDDCSYSQRVSIGLSLPSENTAAFKAELSNLRGTKLKSLEDDYFKQT